MSHPDLAEAIDAQEREEQLRRLAAGVHDAEAKKRRRLALELLEELRQPLIPGNPPTTIECLVRLAPEPPRRRGGPGRPRKRAETS